MSDDGELWDSKDVRKWLKRSRASFDRDLALGRVPEPLRLGRLLRWRKSELLAWAAAGMPDRETWEKLKKTQKPGGKG